MLKLITCCTFALLLLVSAAMAQTAAGTTPSQTEKGDPQTVNCRAMEVFVPERPEASVVIFHQSDKADGPKLGDLLLKHAGEKAEFETSDGQWHHATVFRVKSCFGRGLLIFAAGEANLGVKEDFILRFGNHL